MSLWRFKVEHEYALLMHARIEAEQPDPTADCYLLSKLLILHEPEVTNSWSCFQDNSTVLRLLSWWSQLRLQNKRFFPPAEADYLSAANIWSLNSQTVMSILKAFTLTLSKMSSYYKVMEHFPREEKMYYFHHWNHWRMEFKNKWKGRAIEVSSSKPSKIYGKKMVLPYAHSGTQHQLKMTV